MKCSEFLDIRIFSDLIIFKVYINPPTAIRKRLETIGRVRLCPSYSFATALDSDINQTAGSGGHLSMWENRCMHAAVCLLRAGQPKRAGAKAKSGQFVGQFSWVVYDQSASKGYTATSIMHCITLRRRQPFENGWKRSVESVYVLRTRSRPLSTRT